MKRALDLSWVVMLALLLTGALVVGCGSDKGDDDEDATTDVTTDLTDTAMDTIPEPSTEPPLDTATETEDAPEDVPWDGEGGVVGDACTSDGDCGGVPSASAYCMTDIGGYVPFPGGYCTADCTSSDDCGPDAECLNLFIMSICAKLCEDGSDCREDEGYECAEPPFIGGGPYCIPVFDIPESPTDVSTDMEVPDSDPDVTDAVGDADAD